MEKNILVLIQGIYKIRYHNDGCLLLLTERKLQSFKISYE